jgi:hypothetical protein
MVTSQLLPATLRRAYRQVRRDLAADPYLRYILLLSALLSTFWLWHRLPNFATRDERWRVVDAMEVAGFLVNDVSFQSLQEGTAYWRPFGPTLYLYGLLAIPVFVVAFVSGEAGVFADILSAVGTDLYAHWQTIPAWMWWAAVLPARLSNALLAVGSVYLLYRIATRLRDRATGRLAALLLALTWGVIFLAHEAGEDVPALFLLLLVVYLGIDYVETGSRRRFLWASAIGGLAIGFKPTAGVGAVVLGTAYLLRTRRADEEQFLRPALLVGGPVLALVVLYVSFPSAVVNGPGVLFERVGRVAVEKGGSHGWLDRPTWWWFLRGSLNGLGWPLFVAAIGGVLAALPRLREDSLETDGVVLALVGLAVIGGVFSLWSYFRTHHLLPAFPLAILLVAIALRRFEVDRPRLARGLAATLVVSSAIYAGVGTLGYATQPRDQATAWLDATAGPNATVETYSLDPQEAAVPHRLTIYRPTARPDDQSRVEWLRNVEGRCPDYVVLNYQRSLLWLAPDEHSNLSARWTEPGDAAYVSDLLPESESPLVEDEAMYSYTITNRFGPRPVFLATGEPIDPTWDAVRAGIYPRTIQYGDPQDFGVYQSVIVLERTGECRPPE